MSLIMNMDLRTDIIQKFTDVGVKPNTTENGFRNN